MKTQGPWLGHFEVYTTRGSPLKGLTAWEGCQWKLILPTPPSSLVYNDPLHRQRTRGFHLSQFSPIAQGITVAAWSESFCQCLVENLISSVGSAGKHKT
ncbi:hypothetical protein BaRGS_00006941 [Batillaria attramentaria]|uniref:Uncharacterized protein n=1 Tax=Batillaria attramentaria TaxID=370345 RepID=A0ABD0LRG3_9CAEN